MSGDVFSEEGLRALQDRLAAHVERDALPGYVALVARGGQGWVDVVGAKAFRKSDPTARRHLSHCLLEQINRRRGRPSCR
jgi:hypothetical protein